MTPAARIQAVIDLCGETFMKDTMPADKVAHAYFRENRYIGSKDRREISKIYYSVLRHAPRYLKNALSGIAFNARALVLVTLRFEHNHSLDEIMEICSGLQYAPHPLNSREKSLLESPSQYDEAET
jgi:16S rRNA (cytosine967-C5)-methyltransferase